MMERTGKMGKRKSLADKLREAAKSEISYDCALSSALLDGKCQTSCANCARHSIKTLADTIERDYIERPRFEDGEAVQLGDEFCLDSQGKHRVFAIATHLSRGYSLENENGDWSFYLEGESVKRAKPEPEDSCGRIAVESKMNPNDYVMRVMGDESEMTAYDALMKMVEDIVDRRFSLFKKDIAAEFAKGGIVRLGDSIHTATTYKCNDRGEI